MALAYFAGWHRLCISGNSADKEPVSGMNAMGNDKGIKSMCPRHVRRSTHLKFAVRFSSWPIVGLAVLICCNVSSPARPPAAPPTAGRAQPVASALPSHVPEQLLVKPKARVSEAELQGVFNAHRATQVGAIHQINVRVLHVPEVRLEAVLAGLRNDPAIEFAEPDAIVAPALVPNDSWYPNEWHLPNINAPQAWDLTTGSTNVVVAILDTGVDQTTQPDLAGQCVPGWHFYDNNSDTSDVYGHGTPVAGTVAAASNNGWGVASVAFSCRIMPLRVSDTSGNATWSMVAQALTYAADHGARVANISYKASDSSTVQNAANYMQGKGGVTTVSAGNDGLFDSSPDCPYLLTVGATTGNNLLTSWSSYGNNQDLVAPGQGVYTTCRGGAIANWAGSSFSAPIVAGVAALVLSANPSLTGVQVNGILQQTATQLGGNTSWNTSYGYGLVNAYKAVSAALQSGSTNVSPTVTIISPAPGSVISNSVTINVGAADTLAITSIACALNGVIVATNTTVPAAFSWNTTNYPNGVYTLQAIAYDTAGNAGTSAVVSVTVQNSAPDTTAPTVSILAPANGGTVAGQIAVKATAGDNIGVVKTEWCLNSVWMSSSSSASPTFPWNTTNYANGSYTLQAKAYDAAGNVGTSGSINVSVLNIAPDTTAPMVQILSPGDGSTLSGLNTINVSASDDVGVAKVEWYVDGTLSGASASPTPAFSWDTTQTANGTHVLLAKAYDAAGNVGTSSAVSVTVQNAVTPPAPPAVSITAPSTSSTITQKSTKVYVSASDSAGITKTDLLVDGKLYTSLTMTPPAADWNPVFTWNTSKLSRGSHTLQSVAHDASGNTTRSTVVTVTK
jgi:thermitase